MRSLLLIVFSFFTSSLVSAQVTKYPLLSHSTADDIRIIEIANVQNDHQGRHVTLVKMEYAPRQDERFMIPPGMYINDANNESKRYELIGFTDNSHYVGKWYPGNAGEVYHFSIVFQGLDDCVGTINIYEPEIPNTVTWAWTEVMIHNYCKGKTVSPLAEHFEPIHKETSPATNGTITTPSQTIIEERKVTGW